MRLPVFRFSATSVLIAGLLYAAGLPGANPAGAQVLTEADRATLNALRTGDMRKLVIHPAPEAVPAEVIFDAEGGEHRLEDSDGRLRVVNFWATWCAPCREEFPALDALERSRGGPDFSVIPIATGRNDPDAIKDFLTEAGITALPPSYLDPKSALARAMRVMGLPVTVILNRDGEEIARLIGGADWAGADARAVLDYLSALPG